MTNLSKIYFLTVFFVILLIQIYIFFLWIPKVHLTRMVYYPGYFKLKNGGQVPTHNLPVVTLGE